MKRFKGGRYVAFYFCTMDSLQVFQFSRLSAFCTEVFLRMGCSEQDALQAADVLLQADLRGIDSHGVARLSGYVRLWEAGRINPKPNMKIVREMGSTATLDADGALGLVSAPFAMKMAIERSKNLGSGWVAVMNSNHFGIAAYHAMMALPFNMIGYASTNASPLVSPTHGKERLLGTNPVCYAIPARHYPAVIVDLATSAAANGKLEIAKRKNLSIPEGWLLDKDGHGSTNPDDLGKGGSLLPLGSDPEHGSHKGYALGAMVDIFSGVLSGANYGPWVPPFVSFLNVQPNLPGKGLGHFLGAWNLEGFTETETFLTHMDRWIERFKGSTPINKEQPVIVPGEPEFKHHADRLENGIPLNPLVVEDLQKLSSQFSVAL